MKTNYDIVANERMSGEIWMEREKKNQKQHSDQWLGEANGYDNASNRMPFRNGTQCDWYKIILF